MFTPNCVGLLHRRTGRDVMARPIYADPTDCPFGPIDMMVGAQKTSVRADSSASRGAADEIAVRQGKILIANFIEVKIGDKFEFEGMFYLITSRYPRRSVAGDVDHFECEIEVVDQ